MKKNWQTKKLGEVTHFYNGLWKGKKPPYIDVGVIRNTNFTKEGNLDESEIAYLSVEEKQFENRRLQYGDIILEKSGGGPKQPVGRVIIFDKREGLFSFSNFTSAVRVADSTEIDYRFLFKFLYYIYLSGVTENIQSNSTGIRNLDLNKYKEIEISYPTLAEQKRIVKILDESFGKILKAKLNVEKNLQNSNELFESSRESLFLNTSSDWNNEPLATLCSIKHGFAFKSKYFSSKGDYVLLTPGNFYESGGYRDRKDKQKYYNGEIPKGYILEKDDLLVAMTEQAVGLLGSPVIIPESNTFLHNQRLGLIQFKEPKNINPGFFFHHFNRKIIRDQIQHSATGVKVRHTSPNKLLEIVFTIPPIKDQDSIVKKLDLLSEQTKKLEANYKQKIADLDELKKSLLTKAFSGEL